jgi:hypothetical protein
VQKVFQLIGESSDAAKTDADTVMRMETALAKAQLTRVERRDPYKLKHKMNVADLRGIAPNIEWKAYYAELQYPGFDIVNVATPDYLKEVNRQLTSEPIANLPPFPCSRFVLAVPVFAICGREFRFLSKISAWRQGAAGAMETLRAIYRPRFGRSPGAGLRTDRIFA